MLVSVFTPTYNRGYSLTRLFDSLQKQTSSSFEWIIIDDGSSDNTEQIVDGFREKACFSIIYYRTVNGGKHRAINRGISLVNGELVFFVDSDDWLRKDAIEVVIRMEASIPYDKKMFYAGVHGLKCYPDGRIIGRTFQGDVLDSTYTDRAKYNCIGDKAEAYYTYLIKKYPFPEFDGEVFATERLVWNKIAAEGKRIRYFNECIYYCEYLDDGLTHAGNLLYAKNPRQWALAIHQDYQYGGANLYNTTIQVFVFYLWEKGTLSLKTMSEYLSFSIVSVMASIVLQGTIDLFRSFFMHGKTIRKSQNVVPQDSSQ